MPPTPPDAFPHAASPELDPAFERELLRAYIDSANDGVFVVCDEMRFHLANPILVSWIGVDEADLTRHNHRLPIADIFGLTAAEALFRRHFKSVLEGQPACFEINIDPPNGQSRWVEINMNLVRLEAGEMVIGIMRDVTERRMMHLALQHQASHDDLTGLVNRRDFQARLNALVEALQSDPGPHALLYVDLDQFKVVNDTCGHIAGDELLRQLGARLKNFAKKRDVIARLGGDEFGLLLHDMSTDEALRTAQALCDNVAKYRFVWGERSFEVTSSIGVCALNDKTLSAEDSLSAADAACYVAKDQGRNRIQLYFGGKDCKGKRQEMEWVSRLQKALNENRFQMWKQHILDLNSAPGSQSGHFEVLLRLLDEDGDLIMPARFFPAAERYGLMPAIDRWVIRHLLLDDHGKRLLAEMDRAAATHCAINLSGASLNDDKFLAFLENALQRSSIPGSRLCFEITETVAVNNLERTRQLMQTVKQYGCQFALDDFGSGMSSFGYLKNLPVDYLKIDGSLVRNIATDTADFTIVEAINRIGRVLGLQTIAEFVESEACLAPLREIGIDFAQGYAIHRPDLLFAQTSANADPVTAQ